MRRLVRRGLVTLMSLALGFTLLVPAVMATPSTPELVVEHGGTVAVTEGGPSTTYRVKLLAEPTAPVTVVLTFPSDQISVTPTTLTFNPTPPGQSGVENKWNNFQTVTVTAVDDTIHEGPHTATITHTGSSADPDYNGLVSPLTVSITDNDPPVPGTLEFSPVSYTVNEATGTVALTVVRTGGTDGAVSVSYATVDGSATAPGDYTTAGGTLSWADDETGAKTFAVTIVNDSVWDPGESFTAGLSNPTGGTSLGASHTAAVAITDDDQAAHGVLQFDPSSHTVNEAAGTVTLTVVRTGGTDGAVSVSYATADGSATASGDYTTASGTLSWADDETGAKTFAVTIVNDSVWDPGESFTAGLSNPTGGASLGANYTAAVAITDDDQAAHGVLQFDPSSYTVSEATGTVTLTVVRTGGSDGAVSVSYATADGSATASGDYTTASGTLSWADDETGAKTFAVTIVNDSVWDPGESFTAGLSNPTGGASLGANYTATVAIADDDQAAHGVLQFDPSSYTVSEAAGTVTLTVVRTGGSDGAVSVSYATADGSATAPGDYTTAGGTLSWVDDESGARTFTVTIGSDSVWDPGESFTASLSGPTGGASLGANYVATVNITDDDQPPPPPPPPEISSPTVERCCYPPALTEPVPELRDLVGHWARALAETTVATGIMEPGTGGLFRPEVAVTRAEFVAMVIYTIGCEAPVDGVVVPFADVVRGDWAYVAVARAIHDDIVNGYDDGLFRPDRLITRQEAGLMIARALIHCGEPPVASAVEARLLLARFEDASEVSDWALLETALAVRTEMLVGQSAVSLNPTSELTRAEAATLIVRFWEWLIELEPLGD